MVDASPRCCRRASGLWDCRSWRPHSYSPSPLLILIGILVLPQLKAAWNYDPNAPENRAYYAIKTEDRVYYGLFYLALTGFLALISYDLHQSLSG